MCEQFCRKCYKCREVSAESYLNFSHETNSSTYALISALIWLDRSQVINSYKCKACYAFEVSKKASINTHSLALLHSSFYTP